MLVATQGKKRTIVHYTYFGQKLGYVQVCRRYYRACSILSGGVRDCFLTEEDAAQWLVSESRGAKRWKRLTT